ncbi:hypothetical protein [Haloactinomyces albus]|uniref:Uncharacterized protein n=1 Tax=Haloactinomyces albus TaxID=1352928 RepID=A0AAE3Z921_9ACTN|nr:hypothetical protein [Haloactinomyces albus]MDR7300573.1 hypothetical protein [Haloactinomyces albus]
MTSFDTTATVDRVRTVAASCVLTVAVIHAALVQPHLRELFYLGVLFAIGTAGLLVAFAGLLQSRTSVLSWWLAGLVLLGMFGGYLASRTTGLPMGHTEEWNAFGIASVVVEFVYFLAFGAMMWLRPAHGPLP